MWIGNLPTPTDKETQSHTQNNIYVNRQFTYAYGIVGISLLLGKNTKCGYNVSHSLSRLQQHNKTLITKKRFLHPTLTGPSLHSMDSVNLSLKTMQRYSDRVGSSTRSNTTRLHKAQQSEVTFHTYTPFRISSKLYVDSIILTMWNAEEFWSIKMLYPACDSE